MNTSHKLTDIDLFHLVLEAYSWDLVAHAAAQGSRQAEAVYEYATRTTTFVTSFHQPLNMISVQVKDTVEGSRFIQLHFMYDEKPERILEWLVAVADKLTMENYHELLKGTQGKCEMMLLELANKKIYELIPPR